MAWENICFRRATAEDIEDILRVIDEARAYIRSFGIDQWQDGNPSRETLLADIRLGQLYVFAEASGIRAVAALTLLGEPAYEAIDGAWMTGENAAYLTIHRMATDDAGRGSGLAGRMVAEALRIAGENGCASVRVDTHAGNLAMRRFLEKRYFACCGVVRYEGLGGDPSRVAYEKLL